MVNLMDSVLWVSTNNIKKILQSTPVTIIIAICLATLIMSSNSDTPSLKYKIHEIRRLSTDDDDSSEGLDSTVIILFMFFGLAMGIFVMQVISYFGEAIPYTCLVFLLGAIFSLANSNKDGSFGKSVEAWVNIDPDILLFVFLPPLIFGEAMSLNWYHVIGGLAQSSILAGPGVLVGAALMGCITKLILPYSWSWTLAMLFGSILSATDPVAVVALLKSVGASPKLTILIVGESLLNDGTAMVLFTLFYNSLNGTVYSAGSIISFFFAAVLGSILLGIGFGIVTVRWLRSANRPLKDIDVTTQIAITICSAYLCFFTAQYTLKISGVLACCGSGAMLAWLAPPIILNHETMHSVWGIIEWALNTMIFLLAGLIIGNRILSKVVVMDWFYLLLLYAALMVIRFFTIGLLYPSISKIGHKCTKKEAIFMSWAGLRGALGMALSLIVERYCPSHLQNETSRMFFFVGGIAALTLVINAPTAKSVLLYLGLLGANSAEKELVTSQIKKKLRREVDKVIEEMTKEFNFTPEDLETVRESCTLLKEEEDPTDLVLRDESERMSLVLAEATNIVDHSEDQLLRNNSVALSSRQFRKSKELRSRSVGEASHRQRSKSRHEFQSTAEASRFMHLSRLLSQGSRGLNAVLQNDLLHYIRAIFLEIVRVKYWKFIDSGKLPRLSHSAQFLLYTIEVGIDNVNSIQGARDWACLETELLREHWSIFFLTLWEKIMPTCLTYYSSKALGKVEARREKREVYMLTSFIEAHEHAQRKIHSFLGLEEGDESSQTPEEIRVINESKAAVTKAKELLSAMNADTIAAIRSKQVARLVLAKQAEIVKHMMEEGVLTQAHAEDFLEEISQDTSRIEAERNAMYKEHAKRAAQSRNNRRMEEFDQGGPRSSLFGWFDGFGTPETKLSEPLISSSPDRRSNSA